MADPMFVGVSFLDTDNQRVVRVSLRVPTGGLGYATRLKIACQDHAVDYGYMYWAQPYRQNSPPIDEWLVFECGQIGVRHSLARLPTREAAEMWMLHRGQ